MSAEDEQEMLAAEYALGTLDAEERAEAQTRIESDRNFADLVQRWENRLGELHEMVETVEPPAEIWDKMRETIGGVAPSADIRLPEISRPAIPLLLPAAGDVAGLSRKVRLWRGATIGVTAIAATLLLVAGLRDTAPQYLPPPLRPAAPPGEFVAVLQQDAASPGFILTVDMESRNFTIRKVGADKPADKSYELWLVHDRFPAPRSLGLVGDTTFTSRPVLSRYDKDVVNTATYAVSLEPRGGSPTGAPTGPVVFSGKLIEILPAERR